MILNFIKFYVLLCDPKLFLQPSIFFHKWNIEYLPHFYLENKQELLLKKIIVIDEHEKQKYKVGIYDVLRGKRTGDFLLLTMSLHVKW